MTEIEIKNKLDPLLRDLATYKTLEAAEIVISELMRLTGIETGERKLLNIAKVDNEIHRFQPAPSFLKQAAAYEIPNNKNDFLDLKLYWLRKTTKTNLSWIVGLTPNFEDSAANDFANIGIDFVVPESCDSLIILLSQQYKIRSLEINDHITSTQAEIFTTWNSITLNTDDDINSIKANSHAKLWESFNFEPINKKFYLELVESFSLLVQHLEKVLGKKASVMFTTRLIGRLLFIWFLKKKKLINDDMNYFDISKYTNQNEFYKNGLEVLFFNILNQEISSRTNEDKLTPYLNGGLFDINSTDFYNDQKLTIPDGFFNNLFVTLNKYNFTVDESSPEFQHVAIDPEMLGRIFESLLAEQIDESTGNNKKKATGAFYTPREIVSYMCEESVIQFLRDKVPYSPERDRRIEELVRLPEALFRDQDSNKRRDWKPYTESIIEALSGSKSQIPITILDPAVGSGAFPMGMLHLLVKIYSRLDVKYEKNISQLKRDILSKSIYGVDIEQTAIEICRLRAWLSIIVDADENSDIQPLPNLDFKFTCANTLIPLDDERQETFLTDINLKNKLMDIRDTYFNTNKKDLKAKLQFEYIKLTHNEDLFESKKTKQLKSYRPFDVSQSSEFYDPELHHGIEFFDILIGNPPYLGEKGNKEKFQEIAESNLGKRFYERRMDLFYFFFHISLDYLKPNGILSFITTNYFITATSGKKLRNDLKLRGTALKFINFGELRIFESALGQHNMISIFKKSDIKGKTEAFVSNRNGFLTQGILESIINKKDELTDYYELDENELYHESNIQLTKGSLDLILNKLISTCDLLGNICDISAGIQTSADKVTAKHSLKYPKLNLSKGQGIYILKKEELDAKNIALTDEKVKPWYKNSDIGKYWTNKSPDNYLLYFKDQRSTQQISEQIRTHFESFKDILIDRLTVCKNNKFQWNIVSKWLERGEFYLLFYPRKQEIFDNEKIVSPQRSKTNTFGYTSEPWYASADVYFITNPNAGYSLKFILGILNSKLMFCWLYLKGKRKGDMLELYLEPLSKIPLPRISDHTKSYIIKIENLVDQIIKEKNINKNFEISILENQLNNFVYTIYGLSDEEVNFVEIFCNRSKQKI